MLILTLMIHTVLGLPQLLATPISLTFLYVAVMVPDVMANQQMHSKVWKVSGWFVLRDG